MNNLGDFDLSAVVYGKFTTFRPSTGASFTLGGTPALSVYKDNSLTQSTAGITLTADFDSVTGFNHFAVDTSSDGTFYSSGSFFDVVITTGTVDGVSVVGACVGQFTLRKTADLKPATAGRTLVVDSAGIADANAVKVGPTGSGTAQTARDIGASVLLSAGNGTGQLDFTSGVVKANATQWLGGTIPAVNVTGVPLIDLKYTLGTISPATAGSVRADAVTGAVGSVTGNVGGNVVGSVASVTARVTANTDQLAGQTVTAAAGVTFPTSVASPTNITAGTITTVTNLTNAPTAGDFTAAMKTSLNAATPVVTLAAGAIQAIWDALTSALTTVGSIGKRLADDIDATISSRTKPADTQAAVTLVTTTTSVTNDVGITQAGADKVWASAARTLTSFGTLVADVATAVWGAATRILTAGTNIVLAKGVGVTGFNDLDAAGVRTAVGMASANLDTQLAEIEGETDDIAAVKTKTDNLPSDPADASDIAALFAAIPSAVWDEPIAGHLTAGTTGAELDAAGTAGDPWTALLPGSYGAGTAGKIVGTNLDVAVSTRLATSGYTAPPSAATVAAAVWAYVVEGSNTALQYLRRTAAVAFGKGSGLATTTAVYRNPQDTKDRVTATVDADGNRSAVTYDDS